MPYNISFTTIKQKSFQENSSSALQQSTTRINLSSEIGNIIQKEEAIFKKNPTIGLPEVFQKNITLLDGSCYEAIYSSVSQNIFF